MTALRARLARWFMASLRRRLLLWLLPATFLAGMLASAATYWGALAELDDVLNDQLKTISRQVVVDSNGRLSLTGVDKEDRLSGEKSHGVLLQVWRGPTLDFSSDPDALLPAPQHTGLDDIVAGGQQWHTFVTRSGDLMVRVARTRQARWEALAEIAVHLFWFVFLWLPPLAVFVWFGVAYGLRPLRSIVSGLAQRNAGNMERIDTTTLPGEVKPLIDALNDLLGRLDHSFTLQQHFIADAAHELRTPIMGLSIQAQLLQRASNAEERQNIVTQIQTGTTRLAHLAEQLLTLARLEPQHQVMDSIDLRALGRSVVSDRVRLAEANEVDLGLVANEALTIRGHQDSLRMLLNNLVDNAIRYAGKGACVDVIVRRAGSTPMLEVSDDGPGIPEAERTRVWERFYRGRTAKATGSGLGLSIVRRVAEQHGASVSLATGVNGKGLCVQVCFPAAATGSTRHSPATPAPDIPDHSN